MKLVALLPCHDVLFSRGGNPTAYEISFARFAPAFPAVLPKLFVLTAWRAEGEEKAEGRVALFDPEGEILAEAAFPVAPPSDGVHLEVTTFNGLILPDRGRVFLRAYCNGLPQGEVPITLVRTETGG